VKDHADKGDYEAAQATKDAIVDYAAKVLGKTLSRDTMLIFDTYIKNRL